MKEYMPLESAVIRTEILSACAKPTIQIDFIIST